MITEDYCSYEVAKLLKEKGFNESCYTYYDDIDNSINRFDKELPFNNTSYPWGVPYDISKAKKYIVTPTLQMAMKWLREKFNINPVPYALSLGWAFDVFDLSNRDITGCKKLFFMDLPSKSKCYKSYEEACEAAIKYCLENLI